MPKQNIKETLLETYTEELSGFPHPIALVSAVTERRDTETGEVLGYGIKNLPGLLAAVALARLLEPVRLSGAELKFVRKVLGLKAKELAEAVDVRPETISKMENDHDGVGEHAERLIRIYACSKLAKKAPAIDCDQDRILCMKIKKSRPGGKPPMFTFGTVRLKDGSTRKLTNEWDIEMVA